MALACVLGRYGASSCAYGVCLCAFSSGECGICLCMFCSGAYGVCLCVSYSWCSVPTVLLMLLGQISVVVYGCGNTSVHLVYVGCMTFPRQLAV